MTDPAVPIEALLQHLGWARRLAAGLVLDASRADDAVQDAWLAALVHPPRNAENLESWLGFLVRRAVRQSARGESRRGQRETAAARREAVPASDALERAELQRALVDAVLALREPYKSAIVLAYFEELSPREIARRLGVPPATVRSHLHRGLALLREELERKPGIDPRTLMPAIAALAWGPREAMASPWAGSAASTGAWIMTAKTKIAAAALLLVATGAWFWMRTAGEDRGSSVAGGPALALSLSASGEESLQQPETQSSRSTAPIEEAGSSTTPELARGDDEAMLRGRVVDGKGKAVPGAEIHALRSEGAAYEYLGDMEYFDHATQVAETRSDADGEFELRLARGRSHELRVSSVGFAEKQVSGVQAGETVVVTLRLGASVTGIVRRSPDGAPIAGASLIFRSDEGYEPMWEGTTDVGGRYLAEGLDPGAAHLMVIPLEERPKNVDLDLSEGERITRDFDLVLGGTVEGDVRDKTTGAPIAGAEVSWWSFLHKVARTDATGHYVLTGFRDWENTEIAARAEGYGGFETRVPAKEGVTVRCDFELLRSRVARGRVIDREGAPVEGAYVAALAQGFDREQKLLRDDCVSTRSGADGHFEIRNLRRDIPHALFLRKERFATTVVDIGAAENVETTIELGDVVLPRMSILTGKIVDAEGKGIAGAGIELRAPRANAIVDTDVFAMQSAASDAEGHFHLVDLAAGTQSLRIYKQGYPVLEKVEVELAEGEARRGFVIALGGALSIRGRVLDPDGAGVEGVRVYVSGGNLSERSFPSAETVADGSFVFAGLAPGDYSLRAQPSAGLPARFLQPRGDRSDLADARLEPVRAGTEGIVLQLQRAVAIEGRITIPDGGAAPRAWVVAFDASSARVEGTCTDENGTFRLLVASDSTVELRVWVAKPDPQSYWGFSADESTPPVAALPGVRAGTKEIVIPVPR